MIRFMTIYMPDLKVKLPPNCQIKNRGAYEDVYFIVHPRTRPDNWPASTHLGRTDKDSSEIIIKRANAEYQRYQEFKTNISKPPAEGSFPDIIEKYKRSGHWTKLADKTKRDYDQYLLIIFEWSKRAGHPHISTLTIRSIVQWLKTFDRTPVRQKRAQSVLSNLYKIAYNEGYVENKKIISDIEMTSHEKHKKRAIVIWTEEHVDRVVKEADKRGMYSIGSILLTAIETAQRRSDVVQMVRGRDYVDGRLRYFQSKTQKHVWFNATDKLRERLDTFHTENMSMFVNENTGRTWHPDTVTHIIRKLCNYLGMHDHILMQTRHSQVNYLYEVGCTDQIITAMTGHENPQTMRLHYREKINEKLANEGVKMINEYRRKKKVHTISGGQNAR